MLCSELDKQFIILRSSHLRVDDASAVGATEFALGAVAQFAVKLVGAISAVVIVVATPATWYATAVVAFKVGRIASVVF